MNLISAKVGMHAWSYNNDYNPSPRAKMTHEELVKRFSAVSVEVGARLHARADGA